MEDRGTLRRGYWRPQFDLRTCAGYRQLSPDSGLISPANGLRKRPVSTATLIDRPLTVSQASEVLGLSPKTVYKMVTGGDLIHYRVGPKSVSIRFRREDLDAYLEAQRNGQEVKATPPAVVRPAYVPKHLKLS